MARKLFSRPTFAIREYFESDCVIAAKEKSSMTYLAMTTPRSIEFH